MTRLENLLNALKILNDADEIQRRNYCKTIYENIEIDRKNLKIKAKIIFKDELDKMDYIYIVNEHDNTISIHF